MILEFPGSLLPIAMLKWGEKKKKQLFHYLAKKLIKQQSWFSSKDITEQ
jgi:hypothetical protein